MVLEQTKVATEHLNLPDNSNIVELENIILKKHSYLDNLVYNIALNQKIVDKKTIIKSGDELAFLPPFAGG